MHLISWIHPRGSGTVSITNEKSITDYHFVAFNNMYKKLLTFSFLSEISKNFKEENIKKFVYKNFNGSK